MFRWYPALIHLGDGDLVPLELCLVQPPQKTLRAATTGQGQARLAALVDGVAQLVQSITGHRLGLLVSIIATLPAELLRSSQLFRCHNAPPSAWIRLSVKQLAPCSAALAVARVKANSSRPQPRRVGSACSAGARFCHSLGSTRTCRVPLTASSSNRSPSRKRAMGPPRSASGLR